MVICYLEWVAPSYTRAKFRSLGYALPDNLDTHHPPPCLLPTHYAQPHSKAQSVGSLALRLTTSYTTIYRESPDPPPATDVKKSKRGLKTPFVDVLAEMG